MNKNSVNKIRVMHLASNPEWAGAEVHLATLADSLKSDERVSVSVCLFHDGKLADYLKNRGIDVTIIPLKWLFDISSVFNITGLLKNKNIDILHTHGYKANFIGALASCLHKSTRCVRTEHGLTEPFSGFSKIKMNFYEGLDHLAGRFLTKKIISVSNDIRNNIKNRYGEGAISTIHNGIDINDLNGTNKEKIKMSLGISEDTFVIGIVGRLVPIKGHEYFINAAKLILEKRKDVMFLIVGDGPLKKALESSIPAILARYILFTGFRNDVKDLIEIMDIVMFSSLSEGIPYTLLEAMAAKKAVVATRVGGLAEVISDGRNGLLVNSKDEKEMADKCLYLLGNKSLMETLGEEAKKTVRNDFSIEKMREETIHVYEEAAA